MEPDVLSKDLAAYLEAQRRGDQERIGRITDRARRRRKRGWRVGQHERFRRLWPAAATAAGDEHGSHAELTYQHQRRAHFRLLASGKVTFVRQATVRPDLPPRTGETAYRVD